VLRTLDAGYDLRTVKVIDSRQFEKSDQPARKYEFQSTTLHREKRHATGENGDVLTQI
jgi:hypothetical protein